MRNIILSLFVVISSCGQHPSQKTSDYSIDLGGKYSGVYEYVYPNSTSDLIENHFIVFSTENNKLIGYYYGTSDEFDDAREGYLPAFFVAKMNNLVLKGDSIRFTLNVDNVDFLTKAVDLNYKSTKEAIDAGYKNWENKMQTFPKKYVGLFQDERTIFFKGEQEFMDKTFKRK